MNNYEKIYEILKTIYNEDISKVIAYTTKDLIKDVDKIENDSREITVKQKLDVTINSADNTNFISKEMGHLKVEGEFESYDLDLVANQYGVKAEAKHFFAGNKYEVYLNCPSKDLDEYASMYAYHYINDEYGQKELMNSSNEEVLLKDGLDFISNMALDRSILYEKFGEIEENNNKRGKN